MVYITGEKETIGLLKQKEGYEGSPTQYTKTFSRLNPHLQLKNPQPDQLLPAYLPVILVSESSISDAKETINDISNYSLKERETIWQMQQSGCDIPMWVVMQEILQELQVYADSFRKFYDDPIISTPWEFINSSFPHSSLPDIFGASSVFAAQQLRNSRRIVALDQLYESMMRRDYLNQQLQLLKHQRGVNLNLVKAKMEKEIQTLTSEIKRLLRAKIDAKMPKYLSAFSQNEIRKMGTNSFSLKVVRKGQTIATRLDFLNRSGRKLLQTVIRGLQKVEPYAGKLALGLGVAVVGYDVYKAHSENKSKTKAFLCGSAAVGTGLLLSQTSTLGALAIGGLTGEMAAATCLLFTPAGIFVATIAGIAVAGYAGYKASEFVGEVWDKYGDKAYEKAAATANLIYEEIASAWRAGSGWLLNLYGHAK